LQKNPAARRKALFFREFAHTHAVARRDARRARLAVLSAAAGPWSVRGRGVAARTMLGAVALGVTRDAALQALRTLAYLVARQESRGKGWTQILTPATTPRAE
jgi:hypothetical protein